MRNRSKGWMRRTLEQAPAPIEEAEPADRPETGPRTPQVTRIEPGCEIDGTLSLEGPLVIEGEFRGSIRCRDDVNVLRSGTVEARIEARTVTIEGAVVGDVTASREIVIAGSGRLHGAVETPSFVIERGAFFQGPTRMYRPEQLARRSADPIVDT